MFPGKLLNFKLNRGIVQRDFNAKFLHLLSVGRFTFRSRMLFTYKCNLQSLQKTNQLE